MPSGLAGPVKVSRSEILYGLGLRRLGGRGTLTLLALLEPIAVAVHLQDVDVVREPVEQRAGEPLGGEYPGPIVNGEGKTGQGGEVKPGQPMMTPCPACPGFVV